MSLLCMTIPRTVIVGRGRVLPTDYKKLWKVLLNNIHKVCKMVGRLEIGYVWWQFSPHRT